VAGYRLIQTDRELAGLLERLNRSDPDRVALDLESEHNLHRYGIHVSLIQLFDGESVALIDALAVRERPLLRRLLQDSPWIKVMFDASSDLATARAALELGIRPIFDLAVAARLLGKGGSLSKLVSPAGAYGKSRFQKADWMRRPLPAEMLEYAAGDVLPLLDLADALLAELLGAGKLFRFLALNAQVQAKTGVRDPFQGYKRLPAYARLPEERKRLLSALWQAREKYAQRHDLPPHNVAGHDLLAAAARTCSGGPRELAEALVERRSGVRLDAEELAALIREALRRGVQ